jgi:putative transposase
MPKRVYIANGFYHIFNRGNRKFKIFTRQSDYYRFVRTMFKLEKEYSFSIYSFCLMPNHFHMLINTGSKPEEISKFMHRFMTSYSKYFNSRYNLVGSLFQGKYKSRYVTKEKGVEIVSEYIKQNPIKAGIVTEIECYKWYKELSLSSRNIEEIEEF